MNQERIEQLQDLWNVQKLEAPQIGEILGMESERVKKIIQKMRKKGHFFECRRSKTGVPIVRTPRPAHTTTSRPGMVTRVETQRRCLGAFCGKMFVSEWIGNRICETCRAKDVFRSSALA